ncbi:MAG: hypothetical protein RSD95_12610, partial [Clostridia bacterium]
MSCDCRNRHVQRTEVKPMAIKPILFSTPMIQAILGGRKTMTRRIIEPQPTLDDLYIWQWKDCQWKDDGLGFPASGIIDHAPAKPGDILWVRETWTEEAGYYYYRADLDSDYLGPCETLSGGYPFECTYHPGCEGCYRGKQPIFWRQSIHMP